MRSLVEISVIERSILFPFIIVSIFLAVILIMNHFQEKRFLPALFTDLLCGGVSYMAFNMLVVTLSSNEKHIPVPGWRANFADQPVLLYMVIEAIVLFVQVLIFRNDYWWRREHISFESIKESMDSMPYGICCYYESGMPRLINIVMHRLSVAIFAESLSNAALFWDKLQTSLDTGLAKRVEENETPTFMLEDGRVWSFSREKINYKKGFLYEILATDITEEYEKSIQLAEDNKRMYSINEKLREYSRNVKRITIEKEVLDAKVRVHSELGQTLVATRRYLSNHDIDEAKLLGMWSKNIKLLSKESISIDPNDYEILKVSAEQLGITLDVPSDLPKEEAIKEIIISAVDECITNTYKYAESKKLRICASCDEQNYTIKIINDGEHPTSEIKEKGGLKNLHKTIETKGGSMEIATKPCFCLTITMEKR